MTPVDIQKEPYEWFCFADQKAIYERGYRFRI
jgi:hypothetical protein